MVNFVLSFCRITAASKIFSRNFYLPLLKPLTPREAFRTFRITGKWLLGSKIQRYIPVLLNHKKKRSKSVKNYGKLKHEEMENFSYMIPILDPENENQKILINILNRKEGSGVFVYTIEDRKLNIVLQAQLEYAVRDGDIIDILVSQKADKILIKLKDFKKVPLELDYYEIKEPMLLGEGATTEADEKLHHYGKYTMGLAKIFEDKERQEEEWEIMLKKVIKNRRRHAAEKRKDYKLLVKENLRKLDWDQFEEDAKKVVAEINEPRKEEPIDMEIDDLKKTLYVNEYFSQSDTLLNQLPTMNEISDVMKNMAKGTLHELIIDDEPDENDEYEMKKIFGVKVQLSSGKEVFISGQMVHTADGEVFVPGQTIVTNHGLEFIPGFTLNIDNKPTLINGLIMSQNENDPMFLPTQSTITSDGQLTFALTEDERPAPPTEEHIQIRKERRLKLEKQKLALEMGDTIPEDTTTDPVDDNVCIENNDTDTHVQDEEAIILLINEKELYKVESSDSDSESSEFDSEAYRIKQEQDRAELEKLKKLLLNDGMDKLVSELEDKKLSLQERLEQLRKLTMKRERPLVSYVTERDAFEIASQITQDEEIINRLVDIFLTMIRKTSAIRDKNSIHPENIIETHVILHDDGISSNKYHNCSTSLKMLLKSAIVAANKEFKERPKDQLLALESLGTVVTDILNSNKLLLGELTSLMNTSNERNDICNILFKYLSYDYRDSKVNILSKIMNSSIKNIDSVVWGLEKILLELNKPMCEAFVKLIKTNEDIISITLEYLKNHSNKIKMENDVINLLEESIVFSCKTFIDKSFDLSNIRDEKSKIFFERSICFARALGSVDISEDLTELHNLKELNMRKSVENFLKRMFLIEKLVNKDYTMLKALERLQRNPDQAKLDPRIRQLIRESGVLISNGNSLRNSKIIPLHLLKTENLLGLEDFLIQRMKLDHAVLIIRNDLQAVIPKEALQAVQAGRVPYILIDESGISNYKPLHSLAALKGSKNADHAANNKYFKLNDDMDFSKSRRQSSGSRTSSNFA
ncbi:hypothetical protein WA026_015184 [Henosepilachna vigintioctopunctata]|uniref:Uncharacterized protein n=1 Tax=Henosepilachna vigintioctopunctata TaxID=420089 RepID=A0AAW1TXR2_9CUCU